MKRFVFGGVIALALVACGGETETESEGETNAPEVNSTEVVEMENATMEVEQGVQELNNNVEALSSEVDSLLNAI